MTDELLKQYIEGTLPETDRLHVIAWLEQSPDHADRYARLKAQAVFATLPDSVHPTDLALPDRHARRMRLQAGQWSMRIAAALFLPLALLCVWLLREQYLSHDKTLEADRVLAHYTAAYLEYSVNPGVKGRIILPDSSVVLLNSDSRLRCPREFSAQVRDVELFGEGYFQVQTDPARPMHIRTIKGVTAVVTGTTFNMSAYEDDDALRLTLISGKVALVNERTAHTIQVKPNEEVVVRGREQQTASTRHEAKIAYDTAWTRGTLAFEDTPMEEVIRRMERWYGIHIRVRNSAILNYHLTASFDSESAVQVLELLRISADIQSVTKGTEVELYL